MKTKRLPFLILGLLIFSLVAFWLFRRSDIESKYAFGQPIDSLNQVYVYYNGKVGNVSGRNLTPDNYNLGQKYQCVEFVKRYYYEYFNHKMPESYGHAKDFFDLALKDGQKNKKRDLIQYTNPSHTKPEVSDLLIFSGTVSNWYGHVAILSEVTENDIEIIQQNPGPSRSSRERHSLVQQGDKWYIENDRILGWLRKE